MAVNIDEPLNKAIVHPVARALLPLAVRLRVAPNAISIAGIGFGLLAAFAYQRYDDWRFALAGLAAMLGWHVLDGLDGMVARATGSTSDFGRFLDGFCDYSVFILVYVGLAIAAAPAIGGVAAYTLAAVAGAAHAVQSAYYETRRETYLRRVRGERPRSRGVVAGGWLERTYNAGQSRMTKADEAIDARFARDPGFGRHYVERLAPLMRWSTILGQTGRTLAVFIACLVGSPAYFWIWEIAALSLFMLIIEMRRRRLEAGL